MKGKLVIPIEGDLQLPDDPTEITIKMLDAGEVTFTGKQWAAGELMAWPSKIARQLIANGRAEETDNATETFATMERNARRSRD